MITLNFFTAIVMMSYEFATTKSNSQLRWRMMEQEAYVWHVAFNYWGVEPKEGKQYMHSEGYPDVPDTDSDSGGDDDEDAPLIPPDGFGPKEDEEDEKPAEEESSSGEESSSESGSD